MTPTLTSNMENNGHFFALLVKVVNITPPLLRLYEQQVEV